MKYICSDNLIAYLKSWYETSTNKKRATGVTVELTFDQFLDLFEKRHLKSLQDATDANRLRYMQDAANPFALVLTWRSYAACQTGIFSAETATICSRQKSKAINRIQAGTKLSQRTKDRISEARRGKPRTDDARKAISEGSKGRRKEPWSEERKAERRRQIAARRAA